MLCQILILGWPAGCRAIARNPEASFTSLSPAPATQPQSYRTPTESSARNPENLERTPASDRGGHSPNAIPGRWFVQFLATARQRDCGTATAGLPGWLSPGFGMKTLRIPCRSFPGAPRRFTSCHDNLSIVNRTFSGNDEVHNDHVVVASC